MQIIVELSAVEEDGGDGANFTQGRQHEEKKVNIIWNNTSEQFQERARKYGMAWEGSGGRGGSEINTI